MSAAHLVPQFPLFQSAPRLLPPDPRLRCRASLPALATLTGELPWRKPEWMVCLSWGLPPALIRAARLLVLGHLLIARPAQ